jgi:UDP-N-acetylmuramyl pentapeptide synthase
VLVGTEKSDGRKPNASADAALVATDVRESFAGVSFAINGQSERFELPLLGAHNVLNGLLAMVVARKLGASDEQIRAGLKKVEPAPGRLQPCVAGGFRVIHDAYNANPSSMEAALRTFAQVEEKAVRRVAVLGDMLELGAGSQQHHRDVGKWVAGGGIDVFVAVGPMMKHAADAAAGVEVVYFADTPAACRGIAAVLKPGDAILLKGSHGMALDKILAVLGDVPALTH